MMKGGRDSLACASPCSSDRTVPVSSDGSHCRDPLQGRLGSGPCSRNPAQARFYSYSNVPDGRGELTWKAIRDAA